MILYALKFNSSQLALGKARSANIINRRDKTTKIYANREAVNLASSCGEREDSASTFLNNK